MDPVCFSHRRGCSELILIQSPTAWSEQSRWILFARWMAFCVAWWIMSARWMELSVLWWIMFARWMELCLACGALFNREARQGPDSVICKGRRVLPPFAIQAIRAGCFDVPILGGGDQLFELAIAQGWVHPDRRRLPLEPD